MTREEKDKQIDVLLNDINQNPNFYITNTSDFTVDKINQIRRECFQTGIKLKVVKNSLLKKAFEKSGRDYTELYPALKGSTSILFCEVASQPAKMIKKYQKKPGFDKFILKGAYLEESAYVGENQLDFLANIKSKNELIGDIIGLLQSPAKNVVSALQSGGSKLAGIIKTLEERTS
jgi:large subunit ribosomal protein L10